MAGRFIRVVMSRADIEAIEDAVYRAHKRDISNWWGAQSRVDIAYRLYDEMRRRARRVFQEKTGRRLRRKIALSHCVNRRGALHSYWGIAANA